MNSQYVRIILPSNKNVQLFAPLQQSVLHHPRPCVPGQIRLINSNGSVIIPSAIPSTLETNGASRVPLSSLSTNQQICSSMAAISSSEEPPQISSVAENAASEINYVQTDSILNMGKNADYIIFAEKLAYSIPKN